MNLFFPGKPFRINFFPRQGLSNLIFPGEAPSNFFPQFPPAPPPRSLMVVPLEICAGFLDMGFQFILFYIKLVIPLLI